MQSILEACQDKIMSTDKVPILHVFFIYNLQCVSPPKCNLKPEKDLLIKKCEGERIFLKQEISAICIQSS